MSASRGYNLPPPPVHIQSPSGQDEVSLGSETTYIMPPHPSSVTVVPPPIHIVGLPFLSSSDQEVTQSTTSTFRPTIHCYSTKTKNVPQFVPVPYRVSSAVSTGKVCLQPDDPVSVIKKPPMKYLPPLYITDGNDRSIGVRLSCDMANKDMTYCMICGYNHEQFEAHIYSYYEQVSNELICQICSRPLVDPLETKCGHTFCAICLESHLVVQALCPEDNQIINFLECSQASSIVKRLLDKLLIICPNGCDVILLRVDLKTHLLYSCKKVLPQCEDSYGETSSRNRDPDFRDSVLEKSPHSTKTTPRFRNSHSTGEETVFTMSPSLDSSLKNVRRISRDGIKSPQKSILKFSPTQHSRKKYYSTNDDNEGLINIVLDRSSGLDLGISFVGGSDTPLPCILIQEIYLDGLVAKDGRLRPGDQIISVNDIDLNEISHSLARHAFLHAHREHGISRLSVFRERSDESVFNGKEDILQFSLSKRADRKLGIKLVGQNNKPGLFVLDLVKGSEADLDGRLRKNDRILSINGVDLSMSTQDVAADVINDAEEDIRITISRNIRPQTPDIFHRTEFNQPVGNLATISPLKTVRMLTSPIEKIVTVEKHYDESLGISIAGGVNSQRGNVPIYVTNLTQDGVLTRTARVNKGDILIAVNETDLVGLSHEKAVEELKAIGQICRKVTVHLLQGPETSKLGRQGFQPSWTYWLQLPKFLEMPRCVTLRRDTNTMSLGLSIVGGIDCRQQLPIGRRSSTGDGRPVLPIVVKSIVSGSVAHRSGQLKCGDILLKVNNISLRSIAHKDAVSLFKNVHDEVTLEVVSWPGTIV